MKKPKSVYTIKYARARDAHTRFIKLEKIEEDTLVYRTAGGQRVALLDHSRCPDARGRLAGTRS